MFSELRDFFEQPHAHAKRLLTGTRPLPEDHNLLTDDVLKMAGLLIAAHAHDPDSLALNDLAAKAIQDIARARQLTIGEVDAKAVSSNEISHIFDILERLHTTPYKPEHLEELFFVEQCLDNLPATITNREAGLRYHLLLEVAELRAQVLGAIGQFEDTLSAWHAALEAAQAAQANFPDSKYVRNTLLRMVDWLSHEDADETLRTVLPIIAQQKIDTPTDANGLKLNITLARFFARFGDRHEADIYIADVERGLQVLGCPCSRHGEELSALFMWAAVARSASRSHIERYDLFNQIIVGWVAVHAHRFESSDGTQEDHRQMAHLSQLLSEIREYERVIKEDDASYLSEHSAPDNPDNLTPVNALAAWFRQVMDDAEGDEPSESAQRELLNFAMDDSVPEIYRGKAFIRLGHIALNHSDVAEARRRFMAAGSQARMSNHPDLTIDALTGVAITDFVNGKYASAVDISGKAIDICEQMRAKVTAPYLSSAFMVDKFGLYLLGINSARRAGDWDTMLARMEMMKSRAQKNPPGEISVEIRTAALEQLRALKRSENPVEARRKRLAIWQNMMLSELPPPPPFNLAALQKQLGTNAIAITYFFFSPEVMLACLISGNDVLTERITLPEEADFFGLIDKISSATNQTRGLESVLSRVAKFILPKAFVPALTTAKQLVICPHQALHATPFAALPFQDRLLIDQFEVATVPNLTCLQIIEPAPAQNGFFAAASEHARGMDSVPLAEAEPEARSAAKVWSEAKADVTILLGEETHYNQITNASSRTALAKAKVIHLGFHGSDVSTSDLLQSPMESGLYLYDEHLDGLDISTFDLSADVVILAACHAGKRAIAARGLSALPADSVYGLQAALHVAGAQSIIGGLWEIDDVAATKITSNLHRRLAMGEAPVTALRGALLQYRDEAGPILNGVAFWGAFSLVAFSPRTLGL